MAASNYYAGYTSGAQHSQGFTQVQNPPIQTSYTAPQASTGYAVQGTAPTAAHYGPPQTQAPRQVVQQAAFSAATSAYAQTAPTQGSAYGYTARQQDAPPPPPPTNTAYQAASHAGYQSHPATQSYYERDAYENKATYYSQQPASSVQVSQGGYYAQGATAATAKAAAYQASVATAYPTPVSTTRVAAKSHPVQAYTSSSTVAYPYSTARTHTNYNNQGSYSTSNYGGSNTAATESYHPQAYEAAVYNAAAAYVQQQQQHQAPSRPNWKNKGGGMGGMASNKQQKPKPPPKQPQIHYCDICKISCAGPQTYKEHLEGQKHKKKEAAGKAKPDASTNNSNCYQCELCNITCTGADAYAAHLKGSKHQKVVNLHVKMGRPIPEIQPIKPPEPKDTDDKTKSAANNRNHSRKAGAKRTAAPKITFVGGTKLTTTGVVKSDGATDGAAAQNQQQTSKDDESMEMTTDGEEKFDLATFTGVDKSKIVGSEYLEEVKSDDGKVTSFHCKLCECKFNDPNAKEAHLAGRRHRLQYKKKVQPDLVVETKPSNRRLSKSQEEKLRHRWEQEQVWRWRRDEDVRWHEEEARRWEEEEYMRRMEEDRLWEEEHRRRYEAEFLEWSDRTPPGAHPGAPPPRLMDAPPGMPHMRPRYNSPDDQMVMAKHSAIYPTEAELQAVQNIVSAAEKALKLVSDVISEQDNPQMEVEASTETAEKEETPVKKEPESEAKTETTETPTEKTETEAEPEPKEPAKPQAPRALKGVMRVGVLAKGLLLRGRLDVNLVVLCHNKPTLTLLKRVTDLLSAQLLKVTEEKYDIKMEPEESALKITTTTETKVVVTVTLTSPIMRDTVEPAPAEDDPDVLDRQKCLDALAALRHAKWFQAKANSLQSCVVIIRVMREMCQRVPAFSPITEWALELLVEKSLSSSEQPLGPGEAFRRVLECISTGLFQEGGPGLCDPCEKENINASADIKSQEAEDLTAAAQHALRLQAFRQLHKVLGIDPPPPAPRYRGRYPRGGRFKRRREDSGQGDEGAKKEKKEGETEPAGEVMETTTEVKDATPKPAAKPDA